MRARVKQDYRIGTVTACSGAEFIKSEYRLVPPGYEAEAQRNPYLEIEAEKAPEPEPVEEAEQEAKPVSRRKRSG